MNKGKEFLDAKERAGESLKKASDNHVVDEQILPILKLLNNFPEYYTSSSCAGRIVLLEIPAIGDKKQAKFLGKWHRTIMIDELFKSSKTADKGFLWLLAQSPILHVGTLDLNAAEKLVKLAILSGFKNSSIRSIGKTIVIELCSTERLDAPIGKDSILFCESTYLQLLVDVSNSVMEKSKMKLERLEKNLRKSLSTSKTTIDL